MSITVAEAKAYRSSVQSQIDMTRNAIKGLEHDLERFEDELRQAEIDVAQAEAAADSDAYPVGTRVRHRAFTDITGEVVESDGTGLAVIQDDCNLVGYGFTKSEWVAL